MLNKEIVTQLKMTIEFYKDKEDRMKQEYEVEKKADYLKYDLK